VIDATPDNIARRRKGDWSAPHTNAIPNRVTATITSVLYCFNSAQNMISVLQNANHPTTATATPAGNSRHANMCEQAKRE